MTIKSSFAEGVRGLGATAENETGPIPHTLRYTMHSIPRNKHVFFVLLCFSASVTFSSSANGQSVVGQPASAQYKSLFDGKSLQGWEAMDMSYWSVKDDAITAQSTAEHSCTSNQFLVWQGGDVGDFELKLRFRVTGNGCNSGIQFRSKMQPNGLAVGYQADIFQRGPYLGGVCDELHKRDGPELLTSNGKKTVIDSEGNRVATDLAGTASLNPYPEWNDYRIKAIGQHITLEINGVKCGELIDQETAHFDLSGILGLQLRSGKPMKVQFKEIYLKTLPAKE